MSNSNPTAKIDPRTFHAKMEEAYKRGDALAVFKYGGYLARRIVDDSDFRKSTTAEERVAMAKNICVAFTEITPAIAAMSDIRDPSDTGGYAALRAERDTLAAKNAALEARLAALEAAVAASATAAAPVRKKAVATATVIPAAPAAPAVKPVGLFAGAFGAGK